jgi:hypothetical protein
MPLRYASFLNHIHFSHIGDEFGRNECGGLTFLHTQNLLSLIKCRLLLYPPRRRHAFVVAGACHPPSRCANPECEFYGHSHQLEEEGAFALPQGEFGLDVIALVGALRHAEHRSVPEIHRELLGRGLNISERTVTNLSGMSRIRRLLARIREAYRSRQSGDDEVIYRYSF